MDLKRYLSSFNGLRTEARTSRFLLILLVTTIALMGYHICTRPVIVTITPFTLAEDAQLTREDASRSYFEAWGFALAELLGNVTPGNAKFIGERLKPLLDPKIYHAVIESVNESADQLIDERITQRFQPRRVTYEKSSGKVFVFGTSYLRQGASFENERDEPRTYEFIIKISNYAPLITHIDTYTGYERTKVALEKDARKEAKKKAKEKEIREKERKYVEADPDSFVNKKEDRVLE